MDLGELFIIDSGPQEASFIVAAKAKSFVCQVPSLPTCLAYLLSSFHMHPVAVAGGTHHPPTNP